MRNNNNWRMRHIGPTKMTATLQKWKGTTRRTSKRFIEVSGKDHIQLRESCIFFSYSMHSIERGKGEASGYQNQRGPLRELGSVKLHRAIQFSLENEKFLAIFGDVQYFTSLFETVFSQAAWRPAKWRGASFSGGTCTARQTLGIGQPIMHSVTGHDF